MKTLKQIYFLTFFQLVVVSGYSQQLLNGGFEQVYLDSSVVKGGVSTPFNWTFSWSPSDCNQPQSTLTNDSNTGEWAIKLETANCGLSLRAGAIGTSPNVQDANTYPDIVAHEVNALPDQLSFYYKYAPINNDTALVLAFLFNYPDGVTLWDPLALTYIDTIGYAEFLITESSDVYVHQLVNFEYESLEIPEFIRVVFVSNKSGVEVPQQLGNVGTTLWIDDVELFYLPTSIENLITSDKVKLFPNPVEEYFSIDLPGNTAIISLSVYDYSGRVVKNPVLQNGMFSLSGLAAGMYFVQIETDKGSVVKKVMKE